ncbi:hypothetical protein ES703_125406 [subsurface metagenome]
MAKLAVSQPRNIITGTHVNITGVKLVIQLRGNGASFRYLLRLKAFPLQHIKEVGVTAKVQLIGSLQLNAAVSKQPGKHPMNNSCPHLRFYIISNNWKPTFSEALLPILLSGNKNWDTVNKTTTSCQHLLNIPLGCLLTTHRKIVKHYIGLGFLKDFNYINR